MPRFDHEKLQVYRLSIELVAWAGELIDGALSECHLSVVKQLDRASTSIPLNIAEGNGKRSAKDRCRYLDTARGSALESAACPDVLVARKVLGDEDVDPGKEMLVRTVQMLSKMIIAVLNAGSRTSRSTSTSTSTTKRARSWAWEPARQFQTYTPHPLTPAPPHPLTSAEGDAPVRAGAA